jgi:hypothetical protein
MTFLDSLLNSHPENRALIDGVGIPVVKPAVSLFFDSIRPKHRMPFWQLDSAFLHKELKELISLGHIKVIVPLACLTHLWFTVNGSLPHTISAAAISSSSSNSSP